MCKLVVINGEIGELIEPDCVRLLEKNQRVYFENPDDVKDVEWYDPVTGQFEYVESVETYAYSEIYNGEFSPLLVEESDDGYFLIQDENEVFLSQEAIDRFVEMMDE